MSLKERCIEFMREEGHDFPEEAGESLVSFVLAETGRQHPELADMKALVLYFATVEDCEGFSNLVQSAKPGMIERAVIR